jgi:energy-converting hydrogenase A subunit M
MLKRVPWRKEVIHPLKKLRPLEEVERIWIFRTMLTLGFNRTKAAEALGISVRCLRNKLKIYMDAGWVIPYRSDRETARADHLRRHTPLADKNG